MAGSDKPLTRFLITLAHSTDLLEAFNRDRRAVLEEWGLAGHDLFRSESGPTLEQVQQAVAAEHEGEANVDVAWWIRVFGGPPPRPDWVWGPQSEEDESGGGGGYSSAD